ncbi:MAG: hypothetical protein J1E16_00895 [Muribaculaceae bacterium]|nr:hypothetical protein [Muribaculaceae bacterium]
MKYPYYIVPQVEEYRGLEPSSEEAKKLGRFIAANVGDYASLRLILGIDPPEFARFYPDMETTTPTTLDTIDSFLDKFGKNLPEQSFEAGFGGYVLEEDNVAEESDGLKSEVQKLVDENFGTPEIKETKSEVVNKDQSCLEDSTEEISPLARLIKGRHYTEAIEFIESQNLNNPEKSIYFAHQIRFLKKLKAVENFRNKTQG